MPRTVTVTLSNNKTHTYRNIPDNVTPDQVEARAARDFPGVRVTAIKGDRAAPKKAAPAGRGEALLSGFRTGLQDIVSNIPNPLEYITSLTTPQEKLDVIARGRRGLDVRAKEVEKQRPVMYNVARVGGQLVPTIPALNVLGAGVAGAGSQIAANAPRIGNALANVGRAVQTGGLGAGRTSAQTAALTKGQRLGQLAQRSAGGAIASATAAGMAGQDVSDAAMFGAGLPVVASVLRRVGGKVVDLTKMPRLKAAQIIRESLGKDIEKARAAFSQLSPDDRRLAEQVLIKAGVEPDTFFGLAKTAEQQILPTPFRETLESQAAAREARLAAASGGATATEQRAAVDMARKGVNLETGPAREQALARANIAGNVVPEAERIATLARQRADEMTASGFVPRMRGLEERAAEQAQIMGDMPAIFPDMGRLQQTRGIAGAAGDRANRVIDAQIGLRDTARDMEDIVADLAAEGMQPLRVSPIVSQLRTMANAPGTRADRLQRSTLTRLANELEGLADANGVIDARDLYQIRKTGINDIVDRLLGSRAQPASGTKERTASLLTSIRPMIDDAIEGAGGQGWKDYLTRTRQGFEAVNRQELAVKGAQLAKEKPDEFIALMGGERPQMVEDIMGKGTGQYDIGGLALADPRRYLTMQNAADELSVLNRMAELRGQGSGAAANLMIKERPSLLTRGLAAATLSSVPSLRIGAQGAEQVERSLMTPRVQKQLAEAFLSGQNALSLMNTYPTSLAASEQLSRLSPGMRNAIAQSARQYVLGNQ